MTRQYIDENRRTVSALHPTTTSRDLLVSGATAYQTTQTLVRVYAYEETKIGIGSPMTGPIVSTSGTTLGQGEAEYFWIDQQERLVAAGSVNVSFLV